MGSNPLISLPSCFPSSPPFPLLPFFSSSIFGDDDDVLGLMSHTVAQAGLELSPVLLLLKCWDYGHEPLYVGLLLDFIPGWFLFNPF